MTRRLLLACLATAAVARPADAGLIGATITNPTLQISSNNIGVGYNTTSLGTVIDPGVEFVYSTGAGTGAAVFQSADFMDTSLVLTWQTGNLTGFQQTISTFTSPAFAGLTPSVTSTNLPGGLGGLSITGNTLTVFAANMSNPSNNFTATIGFTGFPTAPPTTTPPTTVPPTVGAAAAVPEPATLAALGLLAVGGYAARRRGGNDE